MCICRVLSLILDLNVARAPSLSSCLVFLLLLIVRFSVHLRYDRPCPFTLFIVVIISFWSFSAAAVPNIRHHHAHSVLYHMIVPRIQILIGRALFVGPLKEWIAEFIN